MKTKPVSNDPVPGGQFGEIASSRGDQRRLAIVEAATAVFLEFGYSATTLDKIIERSGGSRRTLYEQFGSKEGLFTAVLCLCCERVMSRLDIPDIYANPPREALTIIGDAFLRAILDPVNLAIYRSVVAEVARFPEIGDSFYRNGLGFGFARLAVYFRVKNEAGILNVADPEISASQFMGMLSSELHMRVLFYPGYVPTEADVQRHVAAAVDTILRSILP